MGALVSCPMACGRRAGGLFVLAPFVSVGLGQQAGPSLHRHPQSAFGIFPHPPLTVAFCFLGDTRIRRWCVPVTNLLPAGQLSQDSLTRRAEKADTLGECWQARALAAMGSWAFTLPFLRGQETQVRQTEV